MRIQYDSLYDNSTVKEQLKLSRNILICNYEIVGVMFIRGSNISGELK